MDSYEIASGTEGVEQTDLLRERGMTRNGQACRGRGMEDAARWTGVPRKEEGGEGGWTHAGRERESGVASS